jgi:hypothetical protein
MDYLLVEHAHEFETAYIAEVEAMLLHEGSEDVEESDESPPTIHQSSFGICDSSFLQITEYLSHQQRPHKLTDLVY